MQRRGRENSDAGIEADLMRRPWTLNEVKTRALSLGKKFEPNAEIVGRLQNDLSNSNVVVLFTSEDVKSAIEKGFLPVELESQLVDLVSAEGLNDVAVIPVGTIDARQQKQAAEWFLTNNRC